MKSWEATHWARKVRSGINGEPLTRSEKHLLLLLADYHHKKKGYAWPSVERLAADTGFCVRQMLRLIASLEKKGVIWIVKHQGQNNRYFLNVDALCRRETADRRPSPDPVDNPGNPVDNQCQNVTGHPSQPVTFQPPTSDIQMSRVPVTSDVTQPEYVTEKNQMRVGSSKYFSEIIRSRRWNPEDLWLKHFIESPACFFMPMGCLDDPVWWDAVAKACGGVSFVFLRDSFAKMKAYLLEHDDETGDGRQKTVLGPRSAERSPRSSVQRTRPQTTEDWRAFVRRWLCRENEWQQRREQRHADG